MRDTSKTKNEFEKALFLLLESKNYHDVTVNDICALANKTKMTFYHHYKDKDSLLAEASINLINREYGEECEKIAAKETDPEEIEYQSVVVIYDWVARHYEQIRNLSYRGETLPLELFKSALMANYNRYITEAIAESGYDVPGDYFSIFCFEGLYGTALYYAEQLKNNKNKKKIKETNRKACRLLAKTVISFMKAVESPSENKADPA